MAKTFNTANGTKFTIHPTSTRVQIHPIGDYITSVPIEDLREFLCLMNQAASQSESEPQMRVVCGWCGIAMGTKPGPANLVSHSICGICFEQSRPVHSL